jgi:hypothetical protein
MRLGMALNMIRTAIPVHALESGGVILGARVELTERIDSSAARWRVPQLFESRVDAAKFWSQRTLPSGRRRLLSTVSSVMSGVCALQHPAVDGLLALVDLIEDSSLDLHVTL